MADTQTDHAFIRFLGRHLVSLGCVHFPGAPDDPVGETTFCTTCFLMELRGLWLLVTAGHVLQDIDGLMARHPARSYHFLIADSFGPAAPFPGLIPFPYAAAPKFFIHDEAEGLDFGFVLLGNHERRLMAKNSVEPLTEAGWQHEGIEFNRFCMIGFPHRLMVLDQPGQMRIDTTLIYLERLAEPPELLASQTAPMFYARIVGAAADLDIKGMSGCPILGIAGDEEGNRRYFFVAIQSGWLPKSRIIYASSIAYVGRLLADSIDQAAGEGDDDSGGRAGLSREGWPGDPAAHP